MCIFLEIETQTASIISPRRPSPPAKHPSPSSPSLINLMISVDVKQLSTMFTRIAEQMPLLLSLRNWHGKSDGRWKKTVSWLTRRSRVHGGENAFCCCCCLFDCVCVLLLVLFSLVLFSLLLLLYCCCCYCCCCCYLTFTPLCLKSRTLFY